MPKSIIREFDNSNTGITLSSSFAVVVPGYMGIEETKKSVDEAVEAGIYIGGNYDKDKQTYVNGVYRLASTSQFKKYIGAFKGKKEEATAPTVELFYQEAEGLDKFRSALTVSQFTEAIAAGYNFYKGIDIIEGETGFGKKGKLLKTFTTEELGIEDTKTVKFIYAPIETLYDDLNDGTTTHAYYKIKAGSEGADEVPEQHIGNQIAWELLKLGYTVLFKKLNKVESDGTVKSATAQLKEPEFWEAFKNKSTYQFRYLTTGGCYDASVADQLAAIANFNNKVTVEEADTLGNECGRGDIIALLDLDENYKQPVVNPDTGAIIGYKKSMVEAITQEELVAATGRAAKALPDSKYVAIFGPNVIYNMEPEEDFGDNLKFPASFHYLVCAINAQQRYSEWYAVAGYDRGVGSLSIAYPTITFGEIAINTLAPRVINSFTDRAVNLILSERGNYYIWGNRTSAKLDDKGLKFSHFLNIRQLCCTLKQELYQATRRFTFNPNSDILWVDFVNTITPTLDNMKANQGIKDYRITKVKTDLKALVVARIRIVPIEALEDFDISIHLEDSLTGTVLSVDEE